MPQLELSEQATVTITFDVVTITCPQYSAEDRSLEKCFTNGGVARFVHQGQPLVVTLRGFAIDKGLVTWRGTI
jgi:hypothetical protein